MPRGSALLTLRPLPFAALVAAQFACRSAVAPPSPSPGETEELPSGVLETTPGSLLRAACPRRECPLPANLIGDLEEKMVERLDKERTEFLDGFALLEAQRSGFVAELRAVLARRAGPTQPEADGAEFAAETAAARASVAGPFDAVLADTLAWLEPGVLFGVPDVDDRAASGTFSPYGDGRPAPAAAHAQAQDAAPREGQWILPLVRMMARLRGRFAGVSSAQGSAEALYRALCAAERRLRHALEALPESAPVPADPAPASPLPSARNPPRGSPAVPDEQRRAASVAAAHNLARDEAEADLHRLLLALERSRPERCRPDAGSAVCRPAPVDVWTGSEFTLVQPGDPTLEVEPLLEVLDRFLGDTR